MKNPEKENKLYKDILKKSRENWSVITAKDTSRITEIREKALKEFSTMGFPHQKIEEWRNTNLERTLSHDYYYPFEAEEEITNIDNVFRCTVPHLNTTLLPLLNGWHIYKDEPLKDLGEGVIAGSIAHAFLKHPEIVEKHFSRYSGSGKNGLEALNTAIAQDGIFIYVPDGVEVKTPIQIVNIIRPESNIFIQARNLIILGKNSKLTLVHCDDSYNMSTGFSNNVTEVFLDENADLNHQKLQNLNNDSTLINTTYFHQERDSRLNYNASSLNGGLIRNSTYAKLDGEGCETNIFGLFLMDKTQHIDNYTFIDHAKPHCNSRKLFKGILDEKASGVFNGHVKVRQDAQKTSALQKNQNILLTDTAKIDTKPFLEIYADDVKCSHGATVGQLDNEALFYLRSRGIDSRNAELLLMYAFAAEIINHISIDPLRTRIDDMVKKRLRGELSVCEQCVLHCTSQDQPVQFDIDLSKLEEQSENL
jgi:Fe-S cluster assembly protein SufD